MATFVAIALSLAQLGLTTISKPVLASRAGVLTDKFTHAAFDDPLRFWPLLLYALLLILSHMAVLVLATRLWRAATARFRPSANGLLPLAGILALTSLMLMLWNVKLFPLSRAFPGIDTLLMQPASPILLWGGTLAVAAYSLAGLLALAQTGLWRWPAGVALASCVMFAPAWLPSGLPGAQGFTAQAARPGGQPDVILIGVDSLRADVLPVHGYPDRTLTPTITALADEMVMFDDALTPMARTFVSYMSLLTGQYPSRHGARFNLYPRTLFSRDQTLGHRFRASGYTTAYATDESRFANFDESFGFDLVSVPPQGVNDFILGSSYDTITTNLLSTLPIGRWILPHLHGNRAAYRAYEPRNHTARVDSLIGRLPIGLPVFLISHYCLPHWPFVHQTLDYGTPPPIVPGDDWSDIPTDYLRALQAADAQIAQNLETLRRAGRLDNAIVVLFSDHGEGLGMQREALSGADGMSSLAAHGHGSQALGDTQQRIAMGMQHYVDGKPQWPARRVTGPASIIDLAPTLLSLAGIPFEASDLDGLDLGPAIEGQTSLPERIRFVETGLTNAVVETDKIDEDAVAREFMHMYALQPDLRIELDPEYLPSRIAAKQRGAHFGSFGLATVAGFTRAQDCWVLANYEDRSLRCLRDPDAHPEAARLRKAVCGHFSADKGFVERWCGVNDEAASTLAIGHSN